MTALVAASVKDTPSAPACSSSQLDGKKALVFGGTKGIGWATSQSLAMMGVQVISIGRAMPTTSPPPGITFVTCDVLDREKLAALFQQNAPFDILISTATGGQRAFGPFLQMDLDGFKNSFDKLWGYANVVRLGTEYLATDGSIVLVRNLTAAAAAAFISNHSLQLLLMILLQLYQVSGAPARRSKPGQIALSAVGGAVENLVRAVAPEIAPKRINIVSPGIIVTPMMGPDTPELREKLGKACAKNIIPRPGEAEEVAQAIVFLVQNKFVTGTTIDVDGGWVHGV